MRCSRVGAVCEWGVKVTFRPVNGIHSPPKLCADRAGAEPFTIVDGSDRSSLENGTPQKSDSGAARNSTKKTVNTPDSRVSGSYQFSWDLGSSAGDSLENGSRKRPRRDGQSPADYYCHSDANTPLPQQAEHAASHLLSLGQRDPQKTSPVVAETSPDANNTIDPNAREGDPFNPQISDYPFDDGLFLPGSAYLDLHSTLRHHLFQESRSNAPTRCTTPCDLDDELNDGASSHIRDERQNAPEDDLPLVELTPEQETLLWVNWLEELAPWVSRCFSSPS